MKATARSDVPPSGSAPGSASFAEGWEVPSRPFREMYRNFTNNQIRVDLDKAERELREHIAAVTDLDTDLLQQQFDAETGGGYDVLAPVAAVIEKIKTLAANVTASSAVAWPDKDAALAGADKIVGAESTRLTGLASSLQTSVEQREAALKEKQRELVELQARKTTKDLLPQIERRVLDAK